MQLFSCVMCTLHKIIKGYVGAKRTLGHALERALEQANLSQ